MSEPVVAPPVDGSGSAAPPEPAQQAAAPAGPKPDGIATPNPYADPAVGGSGNLDYNDPDD